MMYVILYAIATVFAVTSGHDVRHQEYGKAVTAGLLSLFTAMRAQTQEITYQLHKKH